MIDLKRKKTRKARKGKMGGRHQGHYTVPTTMSHYQKHSRKA